MSCALMDATGLTVSLTLTLTLTLNPNHKTPPRFDSKPEPNLPRILVTRQS